MPIDILQDLKLIDTVKGVEVTHRDVGIGISQVLPVLVMALGSKGKLLAMRVDERLISLLRTHIETRKRIVNVTRHI